MLHDSELDDLENKKAHVSKQACFSQFTDKELNELCTLWAEKEVSAGERIVNEGDNVDSVFLILEGTADVIHEKVVDGKIEAEQLAQLHAGDAIGLNDSGFYSLSGKRTATVVALTNMTLLKLSVAAFHGFSLMHPHVKSVMREQAEKFISFHQE